jgi:hypothetical protein
MHWHLKIGFFNDKGQRQCIYFKKKAYSTLRDACNAMKIIKKKLDRDGIDYNNNNTTITVHGFGVTEGCPCLPGCGCIPGTCDHKDLIIVVHFTPSLYGYPFLTPFHPTD